MKAIKTGKLVFEVREEPLDIAKVTEEPERRETLSVTDRVKDLAPEIRKTIVESCTLVLSAFETISRPDEVKVKFGITLGGEAGIPMVSKGTAEAVFEIEATWLKSAEKP